MILCCQDAAQRGMPRHGVDGQAMMRVEAWRAVPSSPRQPSNQPGDRLTNQPTNKGKPMPAKSDEANHNEPAAM